MLLGGLMLGSMHAVRITHLQHHRACLGPDDVEGRTARGSAWRSIGVGFATCHLPVLAKRLDAAAPELPKVAVY